MRTIDPKYKDTPQGKALAEAQANFHEASQALVAANRISRAAGHTSTEELEKAANVLQDAHNKMNAAEAEYVLLTGGPEPVPLTKAVISKVQKLFPPEQQAEVTRLLETECANNLPLSDIGTSKGLERIRLAVLKVADGNASELRKQIQIAKRDWRDVINDAEYPEATSLSLVEYSNLDEASRQKISKRDREQYLAWLNKDRPWKKLWPWRRNT